MPSKKVFISGCYDLLHSGHIEFFREASSYGDLYVGVGSDKTINELKARPTINSEAERLFMVKAIRYVKDAWVNSGRGILDFIPEIENLKPDILFVNEDGHSPLKEEYCYQNGIEYIISKRIPHEGLPARSTTALRNECRIPYRIDLGGGWLDQPFVSKYFPGAVITISIEPDYDFNDRSGMSTSTRKKAIDLWQTNIPEGDKDKLAKILFCYENQPGVDYVSGSQDSLGIVLPGLNYLFYEKGEYWPDRIEKINNPDILDWLEDHLFLMPLQPRESKYSVLDNINITEEKAKELSLAADNLWNAALNMDTKAFGKAMIASYKAQISMFPNMVIPSVPKAIKTIKDKVLGYKLSGAGGGGYLVLFSEQKIENTLKIRIRRNEIV